MIHQSNCPMCNSICHQIGWSIDKQSFYICNNCQINFDKQWVFFFIQNNSITNSNKQLCQKYVEYNMSTNILYIGNNNSEPYEQIIKDISNIKLIALKINKLSYL
jgi:hypothetical protein